ncbi:MAG: PcfJ domain-containing protein [Clostridia bacterium]|nr:PcfJ domain-containing protein [Clostridia bacterium]
MKRKDLWSWLEANRPSEKVLKALAKAMQKEKNCYQHNHVAACAEVMDGNLVIGVYWGEDGSPYGVYYMTPCGNHHYSKDGKTWAQEKLRYIPMGGYDWYASPDTVKWFWLGEDENTVHEWIRANDELWEADSFQHTTAERRIDYIEAHLSLIRKRNARERRITRITDYVYRIMKDPQGIDLGWVNSTVFGGKHYAFMDHAVGTKKDKVRRFYCSACGGTVDAPWKHNKTETCPLCGATVKVAKTQTYRESYARVSYFYRDFDIKGRLALVMVTVNVKKVWRNGSEDVTWSSPRRVLTSPLDYKWGNWMTETFLYYNQGGDWSDRNSDYFQTAAGYIYLPDPDVLKDTYYEDMLRPAVAIAERGWRVNYDHLLMKDGSIVANVFEMLARGGYQHLTRELVRGYYYAEDRPNWKGKNADEVLGINGQARARLRKLDGGTRMIRWLKTAEKYGYKLTDEELVWLSRSLDEDDVGKIMNHKHLPRMGITSIINYLRKQVGKGGIPRDYYRSSGQSAVALWLDYLDMAASMKLDMSRDSVYKPANLRERHDELAEIRAMKAREKQAREDAARLRKQAKAMEDKYPGVAPVCLRIKEIYEWTGEGYSVLVPAGAWDIMQEGVLLGHCSAREDDNVYLERIEQETSYIMFLRKNDKKDSPWYTMEVEPGGNVIQLRTYGDDDGKHKYHDRDEAKAALSIWRREIAKRLGQGEITKAQKSREMLLKYWDGLQKNGNIIRGGYLKGSLLVDVLQADYKELNGELPEVAVG